VNRANRPRARRADQSGMTGVRNVPRVRVVPCHRLPPTGPPTRPMDPKTRLLRLGHDLPFSAFPSGEGGIRASCLRKPPSSPRRPARLRPLAARQSKGTVSLTLAPSRVRNLPGSCGELRDGFRRDSIRRGGIRTPGTPPTNLHGPDHLTVMMILPLCLASPKRFIAAAVSLRG
jgi:hypothetical protein